MRRRGTRVLFLCTMALTIVTATLPIVQDSTVARAGIELNPNGVVDSATVRTDSNPVARSGIELNPNGLINK